jgi:hypothetical protein
MTGQRKYHEDSEKIYDKARKAYASARRQFKKDSPVESCVKKANPSEKFNVFWKTFLTKYDNPMSVAGAVRIVKSYFAKAKTTDIVALFMVHIEHFNIFFRVVENTQTTERSITTLFTPNPNHPNICTSLR